MNKDVISTLIRTVLGAIGAFFFGKVIAGTQVTAEVWQGWIGGLIALVMTIWGIKDKTAGIEQIQSGLRSFFTVGGGILLSLGKINSQTFEAILGILGPIIAFIYSLTSKVKNAQIAAGKLLPSTDIKGITTLKKVA